MFDFFNNIITFVPVWNAWGISENEVKDELKAYFGVCDFKIENRDKAKKYLANKIKVLEKELKEWIISVGTEYAVIDILKIQDEVNTLYYNEKEKRFKLREKNIRTNELPEINAKIMINIIDAANIWCENAVLFNIYNKTIENKFNLNKKLLLTLYIYGMISRELSLITLCKKYEEEYIYYGLQYKLHDLYPLEILKKNPMIYYNTVLTGNQNNLTIAEELKKQDNTPFGIGFKDIYGIEFRQFLSILNYLRVSYLDNGRYALRSFEKSTFIELLSVEFGEGDAKVKIDGEKLINDFTITKLNIETQLKEGEDLIWRSGTNKIRLEICPFIGLENDKFIVCNQLLNQSIQIWCSYALNGGKVYSLNRGEEYNDNLTTAMEQTNDELGKRLENNIIEVLEKEYKDGIKKIEVDYDDIFGIKDKDYGDYDIIYVNEASNEIFLIESKYFSDSRSAGAMVNDYQKLFKKKGYYNHWRKRCDLVLAEPDKFKKYLGISGRWKVHFLFISSKSIELELQDKDGIVTFIPVTLLDNYLKGKLENSETGEIMRPFLVI